MAGDEHPEVHDPQFLWILPHKLELTTRTEQQATNYIRDANRTDIRFAQYLRVLADIGSARFCFGRNATLRRENPLLKPSKISDTCVASGMLQALRRVGLDMRGGVEHIWDLKERASSTVTECPTACLMVIDSRTAHQYVNIGIHLDPTTLFHRVPTDFEEAVRSYIQLLDLITSGNNRQVTVKELDREIEEVTDEDMIWELRREKFRLQILERYRQAALDLALEEKTNEILSGVQERKRRRVDGA